MTTFISTWNILQGNKKVVLPINANTTINCFVNWGDGTTTTYTNYTVTNLNRPSRLYQIVGTIEITITGTLPNWTFQNGLIDAGVADSASLLVSITTFGGVVTLATEGYAFRNCINLEYIPQPPVNTNLVGFFFGCSKFNGDITNWNVTNVTDMSSMFIRCSQFNKDLSAWNVANVTNMSNMFDTCLMFNGNISGWDVSEVTNMSSMFLNCIKFNQDLSSWNQKVSKVDNMSFMFSSCNVFNGNISGWNVSKVTTMLGMFQNCIRFNKDLSWNVEMVTNMNFMFNNCTDFNGNISGWNVSKVITMSSMFLNCINFNQDLSLWPVSIRLLDMSSMFRGCWKFNSDLSSWTVSNVTNMSQMFSGCLIFNGNISTWDVSKVTNMSNMFLNCNLFRIDISQWNLSRISLNTNAPTLTEAYINDVQPNFATQYPTAWSFTAPVTTAVIDTILPVASRTQYYIDGNLRLVRGFKSTWSISGTRQVVLPFTDGAILNCTVHWGDGTSNEYNYTVGAGFQKPSYTYTTNGTYTLTITGSFTGWSFGAAFGVTPHISRTYLRTISYYGGLSLSPSGSHFQGCTNLTTLPTTTGFGTLNLPTNCSNMFDGCTTFTGTGILSLIPNLVTNMSSMFSNCTAFTGANLFAIPNGIGLLNMSNMFSGCTDFTGNNNLSNWDVQDVTDMSGMFFNCEKFTGINLFAISGSNGLLMNSMFSGCKLFIGSANLSTWDVKNVTDMTRMFFNCEKFTGEHLFDIPDGSDVTLMNSMFSGCKLFTVNNKLSTWNVRKVTDMSNIFFGCTLFRTDISKWVLTGISANNRAPTFTAEYIDVVKPKFSSEYPESWKFTASDEVNKNIIDTILPANRKDRYYMDDALRLRTFDDKDEEPSSSAITGSVNSSIKYSSNSRINIFF